MACNTQLSPAIEILGSGDTAVTDLQGRLIRSATHGLIARWMNMSTAASHPCVPVIGETG